MALVADFSGTPTSGSIPLIVQFTDLSTGGATSWAWDFGDGSSIIYKQTPRHYYMSPGSYTVSLTISDGLDTATETKVGYIVVPSYVLDFVGTPRSGDPPLSVVFHDVSTGITPTEWSWDFGDGGVSSGSSPTHIYRASGNYDVKMSIKIAL
jgi:PKD repeat protein